MGTGKLLIDMETGEIEKELGEGDRIITKEQHKYYSEYKMNFNDDKQFVKLYTDIVPILRKHLSASEFTFLISLSEFVSYEDGIIRNCRHGNCNVVNLKELSLLLDMNHDYTRKMISKLCNKGVVCNVKTGYIDPDVKERYTSAYAVNPYIFFRGVNANKKIISQFFNNTGWKEIIADLDKRNKSLKNL